MKEHPMLFQTDMVLAIMAGQKTQTRRIITPANTWFGSCSANKKTWEKLNFDCEKVYTADICPDSIFLSQGADCCNRPQRYMEVPYLKQWGKERIDCKFRCYEWIYVRESFAYSINDPDGGDIHDDPENWDIVFKAGYNGGGWSSGEYVDDEFIETPIPAPWKPSIHMPKRDARIWLKVTSVRCEKIQDISEDDARAEGILPTLDIIPNDGWSFVMTQSGPASYRKALSILWDKINGKKATWKSNPWVWVIEFEVISTTGKPKETE